MKRGTCIVGTVDVSSERKTKPISYLVQATRRFLQTLIAVKSPEQASHIRHWKLQKCGHTRSTLHTRLAQQVLVISGGRSSPVSIAHENQVSHLAGFSRKITCQTALSVLPMNGSTDFHGSYSSKIIKFINISLPPSCRSSSPRSVLLGPASLTSS